MTRLIRATLFALPGITFLAYWVIADPGFEASDAQTTWPYVLGFSGALTTLAFALPAFGRLVGGSEAARWSVVAGAGVGANSLVNIVEDGAGVDWMFFVFIAGSAVTVFGLLALSLAIVKEGAGATRLLAFIPLGTVSAIVLFVIAGGPPMAATWLVAAALSLRLARGEGLSAQPE